MSLFDDIFNVSGDAPSGLFSASNPWRAGPSKAHALAPHGEAGAMSAPDVGPNRSKAEKKRKSAEGGVETHIGGVPVVEGPTKKKKKKKEGTVRSEGVDVAQRGQGVEAGGSAGKPRNISVVKESTPLAGNGLASVAPPSRKRVDRHASAGPPTATATPGLDRQVLSATSKQGRGPDAGYDQRTPKANPGVSPQGQGKKAGVIGEAHGPNSRGQGDAGHDGPDAPPRGKKRKSRDAGDALHAGHGGTARLANRGGVLPLSESDVPAETRRAKKPRTPEEEAERLARTIFLGNLPPGISRSMLKKHFQKYGEVESVRLRSLAVDLNVKMPRKAAILSGHVASERGSGHAYLVFKSTDSVEPALQENMQEVEGRHIRVDRAAGNRLAKSKKDGGVHYDPSRAVFCGNLPFDIEDEDVIQLFNKCVGGAAGSGAGVTAVRVVRDGKTNVGKGIAFVEFGSKHGALMALAQNGLMLQKRPLRITRVKAGVLQRNSTAGVQPPSKLLTNFNKERRGGPGKLRGAELHESQWQGFRTKGKAKLARTPASSAPRPQARPAGVDGGNAGTGGRPSGKKRPAVAARKAGTGAGGGAGIKSTVSSGPGSSGAGRPFSGKPVGTGPSALRTAGVGGGSGPRRFAPSGQRGGDRKGKRLSGRP